VDLLSRRCNITRIALEFTINKPLLVLYENQYYIIDIAYRTRLGVLRLVPGPGALGPPILPHRNVMWSPTVTSMKLLREFQLLVERQYGQIRLHCGKVSEVPMPRDESENPMSSAISDVYYNKILILIKYE